MSFEYTDASGHQITAEPDTDLDGQPVTTIWVRGAFARVPVRIPTDRVEEFIAGIRDTARQAADAAQAPAQTVQIHICPDTPAVQEAIREIRRAGGRPGVRR